MLTLVAEPVAGPSGCPKRGKARAACFRAGRAGVPSRNPDQLDPDQLDELPELAAWGLGGTGDGLGFGLGGAVVVDPPANGVPVFPGEYSWGGGASTTFWVDPGNQLVVVFMTQLQPPSAEMLRDKLHSAVYEALGLAGGGATG